MSLSIERLLASTQSDSGSREVSIMFLVVITLALVLLFEVIRRQVDAAVSGHQFFQAVVDLIYREITTLGLVEFFLYLMHKYSTIINYDVEVYSTSSSPPRFLLAAFVDVHFMLFYTALFNAIQGCIIRLLVGHRTDKSWVHMEDIDIGHYVAIRKEFDRLDGMIPRLSGNNDEGQSSSWWDSLQRALHKIMFKLRHSRSNISRRKDQLLVPIRFHELRAHLIDSNNLPPRFKVSGYLKRSLTSVLLDFVHISPVAWLMLMATTNLMYFASGMILSVSTNALNVERFFLYISISLVACFLAVSFVLYFRMKFIFSKILHMKLTVVDAEDEITRTWRGFSALSASTTKSINQLDLFWGRSPRLVIVIIQYMQFGYALGFSVLFTFHQDIMAKHDMDNMWEWFWVGLILSYLVFLILMMETIPWYTLCTSMGQLVNQERLRETLAKLKLGEEIRKKESLEDERKAEEEIARRKRELEAKQVEDAATGARVSSGLSSHTIKASCIPFPAQGFFNLISPMVCLTPIQNTSSAEEGQLPYTSTLFSNLFSKNTVASPIPLSSGLRKGVLARKKSLSDGVQAMNISTSHGDFFCASSNSPSGSGRLSAAAALRLQNMKEVETCPSEMQSRQRRRCFNKSISDSVAFMRELNSDLEVTAENPIITSNETSEKSHASPSMRSLNEVDVMKGHFENTKLCNDLSYLTQRKHEIKHRRRLMKTQSEGVSSMRLSIPKDLKMLTFDSDIEREPERLVTLSELTQMSAKDLPEIPAFKRKIKPNRHQRQKSASDGVALMRTGIARRTSSAAAISAPSKKLSDLTQSSATDLPQIPDLRRNVITNRHQIQKSASNGVTLMTAGTSTDNIATRNADLNKDQQNHEVKDEKSVLDTVKNRVSFASGQIFDAKDESIDSATIDDGDKTDVDDIPEALVKIAVARQGRMLVFVQRFNLTSFVQGSRYRIMSAFGPMTCFFIIARVEIFNAYAEDTQSSWYNLMPFFFWLEVSFYCIMMAEMLLILALFTTMRGSRRSLIFIIAAVFGVVINLMCLLLLLVAEAKRCCSNDNNIVSRLLAIDPLKEYYNPDAGYVVCCSKFGQRMYGGLGIIEPFTALIALYPMRFQVHRIANISEEVLHFYEESHEEHHGPDPADKVRSLWLTAIGVYSDIAKTKGFFSGELLQCMLGIYSDSKSNGDGKESVISTRDIQNRDINGEISASETCEDLGNENYQTTLDTSSSGLMGSSATPKVTRYDLGVTFVYPKARLVRRMRRCERRLLPLMDSWAVVDAVLTSHELVLFDVTDTMGDLGLLPPSSTDGCKGLYLSDVAKGRKIVSQFNLHEIDFVEIEHRAPVLREKIEGDDVESTHNYSLMEYWQCGNSSCEDYEVGTMDKRWSRVPEDRVKIHFKYNTLFLRFMVDLKEMEHRNKVACNADDIGLALNVGAEAKVWCRTIARLRGASNLKQNLPHYGDDGKDELEVLDFVKYYERDDNDIQNTMKTHNSLHRRMSSLGFLNGKVLST
ncbi:hypothetical protein ACHAXA_008130 [Cyclostephanos tholiformis]|uniref:Uncharacterized protein n=1 Tax=Cyclostephanos tholiformis TaxID=382380 RepID=A0ABD3SET8_9STRA